MGRLTRRSQLKKTGLCSHCRRETIVVMTPDKRACVHEWSSSRMVGKPEVIGVAEMGVFSDDHVSSDLRSFLGIVKVASTHFMGGVPSRKSLLRAPFTPKYEINFIRAYDPYPSQEPSPSQAASGGRARPARPHRTSPGHAPRRPRGSGPLDRPHQAGTSYQRSICSRTRPYFRSRSNSRRSQPQRNRCHRHGHATSAFRAASISPW